MTLVILNKLEKESSSKKKIAILKKHEGDAVLKECINAALNPFINYFILKIPEVDGSVTDVLTLPEALDEIKKLSSRTLTGNKAIDHLRYLLSALNESDREVLTRIIRRDLRCGIGDATVNKIWENLIPTYQCMLGFPYNEKTIKKIRFPAIAQVKSDGMRVNVICHRDASGQVTISIKTRNGKDVDLKGAFDFAFSTIGMTIGRDVVFDGELVVLSEDGKCLDRKTGNGILNKSIRGDISIEEASRVVMHLWDIIPFDSMLTGHCATPYTKRMELLNAKVADSPSDKYCVIESVVVDSLESALSYYECLLADGEEGIMLKNADSPWENKRSSNVLKFKSEKVCELRVIGFNYGTVGTKWEGGLGSLICRSEDGLLEVSVSGFTDENRRTIFNDISNVIGSIISIKYNEVIDSKDPKVTTKSLFLPRFASFRLDKDVADTIDVIV